MMPVCFPPKPSAKHCSCGAYPFPHRPAGGLCRWPDPPTETFKGIAGKAAPAWMRRRSSIRRRLLRQYALHPIRDRELIRRWLPKLYVAYCRRYGYPFPELWFGGWVPAIRVTAEGPLDPDAPTPIPVPACHFFGDALDAIHRARLHPLRCVLRREERNKRAAKAAGCAPRRKGRVPTSEARKSSPTTS